LRFMLVFYMPEATWIDKDTVRRVVSWKRKWREADVWEQGSPLKPPGETHTLRQSADNSIEVSDTSYDDSSVVFFAFEILTCETIERAIDVAKTHPGLSFPDTAMEVREIWDELDPDIMGSEYQAPVPDFVHKR